MSGFDYYKDVIFYNYANFEGRARRSEYWYFTLFNTIMMLLIITIIFINLDSSFLNILGIVYIIYLLGTFLPSLAVLVRRLHDVDKSGWMFLISFIPVIGSIWLLVLLATDSEDGENQYGPNPKEEGGTLIEDNLV